MLVPVPPRCREELSEELSEDPFSVAAGKFVYGCGAFFALKLQRASSPKQLAEFAKEAENLEKLSNHTNIVQIRDHAVLAGRGDSGYGYVVILMELAACDLHHLFQQLKYSFGVSGMFSLWRSLVKAVAAAHAKEIIHRDLKPQNFLLVPVASAGYLDSLKILATTKTPVGEFKFRVVVDGGGETAGDVELIGAGTGR